MKNLGIGELVKRIGNAENTTDKGKKSKKLEIIGIVFLVVVIMCAALGLNNYITKGVEAAEESYTTTKTATVEEIKQQQYQKAFEAAEERYHTSNDVSIVVGALSEEAKLEVLEVYDVQYVIEDETENEGNIISWLEVPGKGTFTIDLKASEFIIDNERRYVLVRVPEPELTECTIIYKDVKRLLFENDMFNESIAVGETVAQKQLNEGYLLIEKSFASNTQYYDSAITAAESMIINLIKSLNMEILDLEVEIEFMK